MRAPRLLALGAFIGFPLASYVGYPALVWAAAKLRPRPLVSDSNYEPSVTVVVAAHDEEALIGAKVRNILAVDYRPERVACIVVCDGCTDATAEAARAAGEARLTVIELPRQLGKLAAIRAAMPHAGAEIVAFSDANALLERGALGHLVAPFADPTVAAVSGAKHVCDGAEAIYWRYERWIRIHESASGSIAGADGALYAVRASAVDTSPCSGAADDLLVSLRAARSGGRIVWAPRARTTEAAVPSAADSFTARTRTTSGALFALESLPGLLRPSHSDLWWKLGGHKLLRIATPLAIVAGTVALAEPLATIRDRASARSAGFAILALLLGLRSLRRFRRARDQTRYVLLANLAALAGLARYIARQPIDAWSPARGRDESEAASTRAH